MSRRYELERRLLFGDYRRDVPAVSEEDRHIHEVVRQELDAREARNLAVQLGLIKPDRKGIILLR